MTRLPKKRGITQAGADKSLILRHNTALINLSIIRLGITKGRENED